MKDKARLVVIGAGIVGCSAVYHLTQMGWKDIVVIDKGALYETGGSTSHAPGIVFQTNTSRMFSDFAQYTVKTYGNLEWEGEKVWYGVGGIELIDSEARRLETLKRYNANLAFGLESYMISPQEVKEKVTLIDETKILGGLWSPTDGDLKSWRAAGAMAKKAIATGGAEFYGHTMAQDFEREGTGRVTAVLTDNPELPRIECEQVLLCTNIWGQVLADKLGISLPFRACAHPVAITEDLPQYADVTEWVEEPCVRHPSYNIYYRQWDKGYSLGSYKHAARLVSSYDIPRKDAYHEWDDAEWHEGEAETYRLFPELKKHPWGRKFNGMFVFSIDGFPMMGPTHIPGFWTAVGIWVTHSGGAGKSIAEWMTHGHTEWDMRQANVMRFAEHQGTKRFITAHVKQNYEELFDIVHPNQQRPDPRNVRLTPYHQRLVEQKAAFVSAAGWEVANWYEENSRLLEKYDDQIPHREGWAAKYWSRIQGAEHLATREHGALYNIGNFTKIEVKGGGALDFLEYMCANRIDKPVDKVVYTALCDSKGGIRADLTVTRRSADTFWIMTGGGTGPSDLAWLQQHAPADGSVTINDITTSYTGIGLWGPKARLVLEKLADEDVSNEVFPYFSAKKITIDTIHCYALRMSYVGELGWEIYCRSDVGLRLWDLLWEASREHEMIALGSGGFNSLRIEKGYRSWGTDLHTDYNPYEAGLGFAVRLKKSDFLGRDALVAAKKKGLKKKLCCMALDDPAVAILGYEPIMDGDTNLGYVTSADYGYTVGKYLAYGYLPIAYAEMGTKVEIRYFDQTYTATVVRDPQFDPKMERLKA